MTRPPADKCPNCKQSWPKGMDRDEVRPKATHAYWKPGYDHVIFTDGDGRSLCEVPIRILGNFAESYADYLTGKDQ